MRNFKIENNNIEIYIDEEEKLEEFVSKRKGRIMWGFWSSAIEDGGTEITTLWWVSKEGIIATPLKYIT